MGAPASLASRNGLPAEPLEAIAPPKPGPDAPPKPGPDAPPKPGPDAPPKPGPDAPATPAPAVLPAPPLPAAPLVPSSSERPGSAGTHATTTLAVRIETVAMTQMSAGARNVVPLLPRPGDAVGVEASDERAA